MYNKFKFKKATLFFILAVVKNFIKLKTYMLKSILIQNVY